MSNCALRPLSESNWPSGFHCSFILWWEGCYDTSIFPHMKGTWRVQCKSRPEQWRGVEYLRVPMYRQNKSRIRIGHCCFVVRGLQLSDWPEAVGGLLYQLAANLLQRLHIDDPVNAFPEPLLNNFALTPAEWVCELADIDADTDAAGHAAGHAAAAAAAAAAADDDAAAVDAAATAGGGGGAEKEEYICGWWRRWWLNINSGQRNLQRVITRVDGINVSKEGDWYHRSAQLIHLKTGNKRSSPNVWWNRLSAADMLFWFHFNIFNALF